MSGDGDHRQRKYDEPEEEDEVDALPVQRRVQETQRANPSRPMTARQRTRARPQQIDEDDPPGAVGGQGGSYERHVTEQEKGVGRQARHLLEMFIMDRAEKEHLPQQSSRVLHDNVCDQGKQTTAHHDEEYLDDVALTLRCIGDQLSQDYELNSLIDMVPIQSPREIFFKVCKQVFEDGQFNWGRVVAIFYFAYRLIAKAIVKSAESIPWIKEIMKWAMDFFYDYIAWWIVQRGGWAMVREYFGTSSVTWGRLLVTALLTVAYTVWKQR